MKAAMVPPAPGVTPSTVPITAPMACGLKRRLLIAQSGNFKRACECRALAHGGSVICTSISVTAKRPTMTRMGLTPPSRSAEPKVKRATPETGSEPMKAMLKPMHAAMLPRMSDPPDSPAMTDRPRMPSEK